MKVDGVWGQEAEDKVRWRQMITCGDPYEGKLKGKKKFYSQTKFIILTEVWFTFYYINCSHSNKNCGKNMNYLMWLSCVEHNSTWSLEQIPVYSTNYCTSYSIECSTTRTKTHIDNWVNAKLDKATNLDNVKN
jgi:hypothetical protein